jgi:hypothetical protein
MFPTLNRSLVALALLLLVLGAIAAVSPREAKADLDPVQVWFLEDYGDTGDTTCGAGADQKLTIVRDGADQQVRSATAEDGDMVEIPDDGILMCFQPEETGGAVNLTSFDELGRPRGNWSAPVCGTLDPDANVCVNTTISQGAVAVPDAPNDLDLLAIYFDCNSVLPLEVTVTQGATTLEFTVYCGPPTGLNLTITPTTVESFPAAFNTAHALIRIEITSSSNGPVLPFTEVTVSVDRCAIAPGPDNQDDRDEAFDLFDSAPIKAYLTLHAFANSYPGTQQSVTLEAFDVDANGDDVPDHSEVLAIFHAEGCEAGPATVSASVDRVSPLKDLEAEATITVVGPPAFVTVTAAPTELICGEKAEITVSVTDALNHGVSDNTPVEVITNHGGVLAGTGSSLFSDQPVNPLSSTTVEVFDGLGTAYLLTSPEHVGPYEVLAATGAISDFGEAIGDTARVTSQATVTCTLPEDTEITAPDTGVGDIRPPNTGDAGLAGGASNDTLLAVVGGTFLALAIAIRSRFARD